MLDPLTAISLASSIVQFVDFSSKLVSEGYGAYKAESGAPEESEAVQQATERLRELTSNLVTPQLVWKSPREQALWKLATEAQQVSGQILDLLERYIVVGSGAVRTWDAVRKTIKRHTQADKLESLQARLARLRRDISVHLLALLRDDQDAIKLSLENLALATQQNHVIAINNTFSQFEELKAVLEDQNRSIDALLASAALNTDRLAAAAVSQTLGTVLRDLNDKLSALQSQQEDTIVTTSQRILRGLAFSGIDQRHSDIHKQYPDTFSWMFDDPRTNFKNWLSNKSGVFWVSGKAGSGKSTLVKYIASNKQTRGLLKEWAASQKRELVTASFYFWRAGTDMQNSQLGLLQSLVYQTFLQCPEIVKHATAKDRWDAPESFQAHTKPWELDELSETIENIALHGKLLSKCFCFFVDGLDEYTGDRYGTLIELFEKLTASGYIKMCVASRPWTVFHAAYGHNKDRMIAVQDFTVGDMDKYITGMLEENRDFLRLAQRRPDAWRLVTTIRGRADGVFLWVYLVVRRLLRLLEERLSDLQMLRTALDEIPTDLDQYFRSIIDTIEPAYRTHTAGIFSLALDAAPLPLIAFWFLPQILRDPDVVYKLPIGSVEGIEEDDEDDQDLVGRTKESINSWCKDLLEVRENANDEDVTDERHFRIDFLHRTVRDFLTDNAEVQLIFSDNLPPDFNAGHTLVRLLLVQAMAVKLDSGMEKDIRAFATTVSDFMIFARRCELANSPVSPLLLHHLNRVGKRLHRRTRQSDHLLRAWPPLSLTLHESCFPEEFSFVAHVVEYEVVSYVRLCIDKAPEMIKGRKGAILLHNALQPVAEHHSLPHDRLPNYDMLVLLLGKGADPNLPLDDNPDSLTPWEHFLDRCSKYSGRGEWEAWPHAKLLLKFGADPDLSLMQGKMLVQRYRKSARHTLVPNIASIEQCLSKTHKQSAAPEVYACLEEARFEKARKAASTAPSDQNTAPNIPGILSAKSLLTTIGKNLVPSRKARR